MVRVRAFSRLSSTEDEKWLLPLSEESNLIPRSPLSFYLACGRKSDRRPGNKTRLWKGRVHVFTYITVLKDLVTGMGE